jgi:CBS domain containing-hemolysin-like protein
MSTIWSILGVLAVLGLTFAAALFVAAEFSLSTLERGTVDAHVNAVGDLRARQVSRAHRTLSFQLSGAQLGITLAALLTGYLAEPALSRLLRPLFGDNHTLTYFVALAIATLFSMLFGELVPKNAALARPMPIVRKAVPPLRVFSKMFAWLIDGLNGTANWIVRRLGVEPQEELASARSPEELGLLAVISARAGALPPDTAVLMRRTIRFGDKRAAEAMTPRVDVEALRADATVADLLAAARDTGHSRFPVYEQTLDTVTGIATVKDALGVPPVRRSTTTVAAVAREPVYVPESLDLDGVLHALRSGSADMAVVVDEYGGTDGVVTVEDLVEELVGEISDEHDVAEPGAATTYDVVLPEAADSATHDWVVDGLLREDELEERTGFRLPEGPYETLAGFLMARLGHIPVPGETVTEAGWEFTVVEVDRHRIEQVRVARLAPADGSS